MVEDNRVVVETNLTGAPVRRGKVRDVYDLGDELLLVATDRISAYDVIMPTPIPGKGRMLTRISAHWFGWLGDLASHHVIGLIGDDMDDRDIARLGVEGDFDQLRGRTMRCRKTEVVPIECVVRGYLAGSGWVDYQRTGAVCGVELPKGMAQCQRLDPPIFTPATKAESGHDENISFDQACDCVGAKVMTLLRDRSIEIYHRAAGYARDRGIIIADTKFEWGRLPGPSASDSESAGGARSTGGDEYLLIDEVLTPDSSRFWPVDKYEAGRDQESFDKQYVRNYLTTLVEAGRWDKTAPGPELPGEIVMNTAANYAEALRLLLS